MSQIKNNFFCKLSVSLLKSLMPNIYFFLITVRNVGLVLLLITTFILQAKKFLKCDWLRPVVFEPNLKYLHVKNYSFHGDLNDRNNMAEIFPKCDEKNYKN